MDELEFLRGEVWRLQEQNKILHEMWLDVGRRLVELERIMLLQDDMLRGKIPRTAAEVN
jgi:hypothetical protein